MIDKKKKHGPNFMELAFRLEAKMAIPDGGGIAAGIDFLMDKEKQIKIMEKAFEQAETIIQIIREAPDNTYGNDEEVIAKAILDKIKARESGILRENDDE
jgi:hypothetical protein